MCEISILKIISDPSQDPRSCCSARGGGAVAVLEGGGEVFLLQVPRGQRGEAEGLRNSCQGRCHVELPIDPYF